MSIRKKNELPEDFMIRMGIYFSGTVREDYFNVAAEITKMREEINTYKALLFQAQTERDVARATVCTSPWEDSPPCRGIQRQLDKIAALKTVLHSISLGSQNSMTTKENLGAEARRVLKEICDE